MKSALRKLIPSLVMVLITAAMVGTSTFAWFSMNNKVTVTGMTVTTKVSSNLFIAETNTENNFDSSLTENVTGRVRPVSTVTALNDGYFYAETSNVLGSGDAKSDTYFAYSETADLTNTAAKKTKYDSDFNTRYGMTDSASDRNVLYGFIDYTFYIKATNVEASAKSIKMTKCDLKYNNGNLQERAWRVAVFAHKVNKEETYSAALVGGDRKAILSTVDAVNFTANKAVSSTTALGDVSYINATWDVASITASSTEYYYIVVRLWLEGEDNTCNNATFATLTANYTLDLGFSLEDATNTFDAVQKVGNTIKVTNTTNVLSLANGNGETMTAYQWKKDGSNIDSATSATYDTTGTAGTYTCEVTTKNGNTYPSEPCVIAAP